VPDHDGQWLAQVETFGEEIALADHGMDDG
jgi:hypothetical protein